VIRLSALFILIGLATVIAVMLRTEADTAIAFTFAGQGSIGLGILVYVIHLLRPVRMSDDEHRLYELAFTDMERRDFVEFARLGEWRDAGPGESLIASGQEVTEALVLLEGSLSFRVEGEEVGVVGAGELLGTATILNREPAFGDAITLERCHYLALPVEPLQAHLANKPKARIALAAVVSRDLAEKLKRVVVQRSGASSR